MRGDVPTAVEKGRQRLVVEPTYATIVPKGDGLGVLSGVEGERVRLDGDGEIVLRVVHDDGSRGYSM